jgi:thioredoxin reductase (NADPH)
MNDHQTVDLAIVGAGAAGLTASIFASRYQLLNVVIGELWGGEIANASIIENYPGFGTITGAELTQKLIQQVQKFGAEVRGGHVSSVKKIGTEFVLTADSGEVHAQTVLLSMGLRRRHLNIPGEDRLAGRGVSYCATCDAAFFKGKDTAVVGGGDASLTAALHLAEVSPRVYIIVRAAKFRGEPIWQKQVSSNPKIRVLFETNVLEILGDQAVTAVTLNRPYEGKESLTVEGVFVEIGADPDGTLAKDLGIEADEKGFIKVDENMHTNIEGAYAAGDVTTADAHFDQILSAAAQGGMAARSAFFYLGQSKMSQSPQDLEVEHVI